MIERRTIICLDCGAQVVTSARATKRCPACAANRRREKDRQRMASHPEYWRRANKTHRMEINAQMRTLRRLRRSRKKAHAS
jgi:DNA-directed RNA polymerase subunit RPC12/RpoP